MYIVGIIKTDFPKVLINPKSCIFIQDLHEWLLAFFNKEDFQLSEPITLDSLTASLQNKKPVRVNINGYNVAVLLGESDIIQNSTERYVHVMGLDLLKSTEEEIAALIQKYVK